MGCCGSRENGAQGKLEDGPDMMEKDSATELRAHVETLFQKYDKTSENRILVTDLPALLREAGIELSAAKESMLLNQAASTVKKTFTLDETLALAMNLKAAREHARTKSNKAKAAAGGDSNQA